ncbi:CMRF35-like molecule 5 [Onychostoma macrolepis]|uniref:Immunoglobulin V-set domain-containing protein n=1 Tax=Onychostoma macrolepis TaxID=369639 RepID=A0A7J6DG36_9TELE|nr:CMRF35-like molecule 5 [Onychostoma macrolepis]KAF4118217.1 hypothetical protein G5714_000268 [Onychostoma macrolepis]
MKSFHMLWIWIFLSGFRNLATDGTDIHGYTGKGATITCSHGWASTNIKYFCRDPCGYRDILVKSDQSPTGRYTLKEHRDGTFTVNIADLQESESGIYWCAVDRSIKDSYKEVKLTVSKHPSKSITTSTQPYKDIQTSTDSLTTTPAAHSESPSVTASKTSRDSSPDDTTLSLSNSICEDYSVYIICCRWSGHDHICSWIGHRSSVQEKTQDIRRLHAAQ